MNIPQPSNSIPSIFTFEKLTHTRDETGIKSTYCSFLVNIKKLETRKI